MFEISSKTEMEPLTKHWLVMTIVAIGFFPLGWFSIRTSGDYLIDMSHWQQVDASSILPEYRPAKTMLSSVTNMTGEWSSTDQKNFLLLLLLSFSHCVWTTFRVENHFQCLEMILSCSFRATVWWFSFENYFARCVNSSIGDSFNIDCHSRVLLRSKTEKEEARYSLQWFQTRRWRFDSLGSPTQKHQPSKQIPFVSRQPSGNYGISLV